MRCGMAVMLLVAGAAAAQRAADQPAFDVASVKPSPPVASGQNININLGTARHGEVTLRNTTLSDCIRWAYELVSDDQVSGPDWTRSYTVRFDIDAKAPPDTPREQLMLMMQRLLAERFQLVIHREPRPLPHLELEVAKNGPKLHRSDDDATPSNPGYGRGRLFYDHVSMRTLTVLLSRQLRQPVLDRTGIDGFYDVKLEWAPDDSQPAGRADGAEAPRAGDVALPDIFGAVEAQLGLKLEMKKTPVEILVIDHAEKTPSGN